MNDLWEDAYTCPIYAMNCTTKSAIYVMEKDGFVELIGKENFHKNIVDALDYAEQLVK